MVRIKNDVCVITGAIGVMGSEICREFTKQKADLVLIHSIREGRDVITLIQRLERIKNKEIRGVDINKPL